MTDRVESTDRAPRSDGGDRTGSQWYRTLVETVPDGVFRLDADDRIVAVDDTLLEQTGYVRESVLGKHVSLLVDDAGAGLCKRAQPATLDDRERQGGDRSGVTSVVRSVRTASGTELPCELRLGTVPAADGHRGTVGVVRELESDAPDRESPETPVSSEPADADRCGTAGTDRCRTTDADRRETADWPVEPGRESGRTPLRSVESIAAVLEGADVGVFVLDEEFDVAWINDAAERYFDLEGTAVVGRSKTAVIDETIRHRVADPDRFVDTVRSIYDDNAAAERFECHVTPGDGREERWLEHRSKPIESGPYAGGRVELYYDVTEQHRRAYQLRRLNEAVREWLGTETREAVAEQACHHLRDILDLDLNGVFLHEPATATLEPVAWSEPATALFDELPAFEEGEGIAWRVFETGEPVIYDDVTADSDVYNPDTPIRSEICLPIGDHGIVIIGSEEREAFDEGDLSLAKILASSLEATFDRISHERTLERERSQTEKLLQTAPVAISVEDADGETVLANRRAQAALGLDDGAPLGETDLLAEFDAVDADGEPIGPEGGPSARVRATGEPVADEVVAIDGADGDRTWFSITAVPVFGPDGSLDRVVSAGEDVTALKEQERRLERRKRDLETELSEILGRVSDAFYALDDEWRFTHVNDRAAEIMQRSEADLLGRSVWDVYPDEPASRIGEAFREAMATQEPVTVETDATSLDAWLELTVYPSETGLSVYFRDVTGRKERERALAKYETLVETIEDGIYALDERGRFTTVNDAYVAMTGYDRGELLGSHASLVVGEDVMDHAGEIAVDETDDATLETRLRTKTGDSVPVEATVTMLSTTDGGRERIGVVRDITERKDRQRRLEASEQRYRTLAENFPNGIVALFDEELRYTAAGGQLLDELDVDRAAELGQTIYERYPDELVAEVEPHFRAALQGDERTFEATYRSRTLRATTLPIRTGGDVTGGMLVVQDITERTEYRRKLEESNERLEQFAYAASHDLQEPLRMITSYLQLIERRYADELDADGREFIDYAVDGADRMREMIDGLLEYSRVETQGEPLEPVDLNRVLADVREDLQVSIEETDAEIAVEDLPHVLGDASQLRQVFQNLLSNAITYSGDEPPRIRVDAERRETQGVSERSSVEQRSADSRAAESFETAKPSRDDGSGEAASEPPRDDGEVAENGGEWALSVRDEGIGIDPDDQERIFQVFQRLHGREEHPGTGIGLALCHRIVERHGGEISVDSEPGEGTTFTVTLPAVDDTDE